MHVRHIECGIPCADNIILNKVTSLTNRLYQASRHFERLLSPPKPPRQPLRKPQKPKPLNPRMMRPMERNRFPHSRIIRRNKSKDWSKRRQDRKSHISHSSFERSPLDRSPRLGGREQGGEDVECRLLDSKSLAGHGVDFLRGRLCLWDDAEYGWMRGTGLDRKSVV